MTLEEAILTMGTIKTLEAKKENLEDFTYTLKDRVKVFLTDQTASSAVLGTHKVFWTEYEITRFDTKVFKGGHKDLYTQYEVKANIKQFTISGV